MLEHALKEESKQNEILKLKERILKESVEQKLITEQPSLKAFLKASFSRSSNASVSNSRYISNGKSRVLSQGRTIEEERQSKTFSSEVDQSQLPPAARRAKDG